MGELDWLIAYLLREMPAYRPQAERYRGDLFGLFRALVNVRPPGTASAAFLTRQDAFLRRLIAHKGIVDAGSLAYDSDGLSVWRGDITTLRCDGIVNAANSALLGCFQPNHGCIDNAIHTFAGVQLRAEGARVMQKQGREEPPGQAKMTSAYNLPSRYVLNTVGPIVSGQATDADRETLAACYRSCLDLADQKALRTVAFCCVSTGEYHFPNEEAAKIAIATVRRHAAVQQKRIKVVFNVFKECDEALYTGLLAPDARSIKTMQKGGACSAEQARV